MHRSFVTLAWLWLAGEAGGAAVPPLSGNLASVKSAVVNPPASPLLASYAVSTAPQALRRRPQASFSPHARRLRSRTKPASLTVGKLLLAKAAAPAVQLVAETRLPVVPASPPPKAALPQGPSLSLLHRGIHKPIAAAAEKESVGGAKVPGNSSQNSTIAAAGPLPEKQNRTASPAHREFSSSTPGGSGITIASNRRTVAFDNGTGDGKSEESTRRREDTVGSELRQREKEQFLGLPKLFWALVADVVAMGAFVLCIPWILHIARRRRAAPVQN